MPRRRPPRVFPERVTSAIESMIPGTLGGRVSSAAPIMGDSVAATVGGNAGVVDQATGDAHKRDKFTLVSDGVQDLDLTYWPIDESEIVSLRGVEAEYGVDWSRDGSTLSLLAPLDARTGDVVQVTYEYRFGAPVTAEPGEWRYLQTTLADSTDYAAPAFDDSGWAGALLPMGTIQGTLPALPDAVLEQTWDLDSRLWLRRTLPPSTVGYRITGNIDNTVTVYFEGSVVLGPVTLSGAGAGGSFGSVHIDALTGGVLAVKADDDATTSGTDDCYIDVRVTESAT